MEKLKVRMRLIDNFKEEAIINEIGEYIKDNNSISFYDKNVLVYVIINDKIMIKRSNSDYDLTLIFGKNEVNYSKYNVYSPRMAIDVETTTTNFIKTKNSFDIEYILKLSGQVVGKFSIDFKMEENDG